MSEISKTGDEEVIIAKKTNEKIYFDMLNKVLIQEEVIEDGEDS